MKRLYDLELWASLRCIHVYLRFGVVDEEEAVELLGSGNMNLVSRVFIFTMNVIGVRNDVHSRCRHFSNSSCVPPTG